MCAGQLQYHSEGTEASDWSTQGPEWQMGELYNNLTLATSVKIKFVIIIIFIITVSGNSYTMDDQNEGSV